MLGSRRDGPSARDLAELIGALPRRRRTLRIGIDGRGGSGKSTLARHLAEKLPNATVVQFDDFYLSTSRRRERRDSGAAEIGGDFEWRRLHAQVLEPLAADEPARYQRYDWDRDELAEWHEIEPGGVVIVEGNYCTRSELFGLYDFTIWVEAPHEVRLQRGLDRDGEQARERWLTEWIPEEDRYIAESRPAERVNIVIDGTS